MNGTCHHDCPDSCGWQVTVTDGIAVKLRGNKEHPYSQGELCPKVNRFLDHVYSPDRILTPLRRTGPKGSGEFEPTTWDDALATIANNLHRVIDTYGAEAVLPYSSAGNQSLLSLMGARRPVLPPHGRASRVVSALCGPTVGAGIAMTNGTGKTLDAARVAAQQADHPLGDEHPAHEPPSVADDRGRQGPAARASS